MKAPKLLKNESATSFRRRVKAWEQATGKKYSAPEFSREKRVLSNKVLLGTFGDQTDYSQDYSPVDQAKEEALSPSYYQEYLQSDAGKKFLQSEAAIQEAIETDRREEQLLKISKEGVNLSEAAKNREEEQQVENTGGLTDSQEVGKDVLLEKARKVREAKTDLLVTQGAVQQQQVLDRLGGQEYTTSFREAFRNANVSQVYEDTMGTDSPLVKSNVFTIDPATGLPLGVMGRSQRRAWDEANAKRLAQEAMDKNPEYKDPTDGSDTPKEWTTDDPIVDPKLGTKLGEGLTKDLNVSDKSNPEISFKPANDDEDD